MTQFDPQHNLFISTLEMLNNKPTSADSYNLNLDLNFDLNLGLDTNLDPYGAATNSPVSPLDEEEATTIQWPIPSSALRDSPQEIRNKDKDRERDKDRDKVPDLNRRDSYVCQQCGFYNGRFNANANVGNRSRPSGPGGPGGLRASLSPSPPPPTPPPKSPPRVRQQRQLQQPQQPQRERQRISQQRQQPIRPPPPPRQSRYYANLPQTPPNPDPTRHSTSTATYLPYRPAPSPSLNPNLSLNASALPRIDTGGTYHARRQQQRNGGQMERGQNGEQHMPSGIDLALFSQSTLHLFPGVSSGIASASSHANGILNGVANGSVNGVANGSVNGVANGSGAIKHIQTPTTITPTYSSTAGITSTTTTTSRTMSSDTQGQRPGGRRKLVKKRGNGNGGLCLEPGRSGSNGSTGYAPGGPGGYSQWYADKDRGDGKRNSATLLGGFVRIFGGRRDSHNPPAPAATAVHVHAGGEQQGVVF